MQGLSPIFIIEEEHKLILRAVNLLEDASKIIIRSSLPKEFWEKIISFFNSFYFNNHYVKEENMLLPEIIRYNNSEVRQWSEMIIEEHNISKGLLKEIEGHSKKLGEDIEAPLKLIKSINEFVKLVRKHISQETHMLPKLAMPFPRGLMERLYRRFAALDTEYSLEHYKKLIEGLENRSG